MIHEQGKRGGGGGATEGVNRIAAFARPYCMDRKCMTNVNLMRLVHTGVSPFIRALHV